MKNRWVIITGGGSGTRMGADIPKQFLPLMGTPVIFHTIEAFIKAIPGIHIVVVLPLKWHEYFSEIAEKYLRHPYILAEGGATRFLSIKNGLARIPDEKGIVAIHDAVRPLVSRTVIVDAFTTAAEQGSAVPVVEMKDSVRKITGDDSVSVDRRMLRIVQTPQCFDVAILRPAYENVTGTDHTDDATVVEKMGGKIYLTNGAPENIKLTTPFDLQLVEMLLQDM